MKAIPRESLAHIFQLGTQTERGRPASLREAAMFASLVSHVSWNWREIALSTPSLWRTIFMCGPFPPIDDFIPSHTTLAPVVPLNDCSASWRRKIEQMQVYLRRSWPVPLELCLDLRDPTWSIGKDELSHSFIPSYIFHLIDILLPHLSRWEDFEILSDTWAPLYLFMERCRRYSHQQNSEGHLMEAIKLRRLALSRCNAFFVLEGMQFHPLELSEAQSFPLFAAPFLRGVTLNGAHISWLNLPCRNLISLELSYHAQNVSPSLREFTAMLKASPNLQRLTVVGWGVRTFDGDDGATEQSIELPRLDYLRLGWVNVRHTLKLLTLFSWMMPGLHTLELEDVSNSLDPSTSRDSSDILDYLSSNLLGFGSLSLGRLLPDIRYLRINSISASIQSHSQFMSGLQSLSVLSLHNIDDSLMLLLASTWAGHDRGTRFLCPELHRVRISPAGAVSEASLEELASARRASVIRTGRVAEANLEVSSGRENNALIIEVESLYDSDSDIDDQTDGGIEEDYVAGDPAHFFDQPLEGEAHFDYSGVETEPETRFDIVPSSLTSDVLRGSVRDFYVLSGDESASVNSAILAHDKIFGTSAASERRSYQKFGRPLLLHEKNDKL